MASEAERRPLGVFECQLCGLTAPYSYVGQKPPNTQSVVLLEESYVMKDPFSPDRDRFLVLGAQCSVCGRLVCVGPVGVQSVLLQEVLSALRPGEPWRLPCGDPAGPGEEEGPSLHEVLGPGLSRDLSSGPTQSPLWCLPVPGSRSVAEQAGRPRRGWPGAELRPGRLLGKPCSEVTMGARGAGADTGQGPWGWPARKLVPAVSLAGVGRGSCHTLGRPQQRSQKASCP